MLGKEMVRNQKAFEQKRFCGKLGNFNRLSLVLQPLILVNLPRKSWAPTSLKISLILRFPFFVLVESFFSYPTYKRWVFCCWYRFIWKGPIFAI